MDNTAQVLEITPALFSVKQSRTSYSKATLRIYVLVITIIGFMSILWTDSMGLATNLKQIIDVHNKPILAVLNPPETCQSYSQTQPKSYFLKIQSCYSLINLTTLTAFV